MKALVTGSSGFYGTHLCDELDASGYEVIKCDIKTTGNTIAIDILNAEMVRNIIDTFRPDVIINMAGQANVGLSWSKPQFTIELNIIGLINILEAVKELVPETKIIAIGSSDEYGNLKDKGANVTEDIPVCPITPYAISKQAQEQFAQLYVRNYGLNVCMIRQFNLGGAGQMKGFMIPDFASGIAEIEAGKREYLSVGNLESARDYTHVKDACRAIRMIAEKGHAGEVYNVCSGETFTAQEVLNKLLRMAKKPIEVRQDPTRMRPSDTPVVCGNHDKLTKHTGWLPELDLDQILNETLEYWREYTKITRRD